MTKAMLVLLTVLFRFTRYRAKEIALHQAPLLWGISQGLLVRERKLSPDLLHTPFYLLFLSVVLFFLIYLWNDLCEQELDRHDPDKPKLFAPLPRMFLRILLWGVILSFFIPILGAAAISREAFLCTSLVAMIGFLYSLPGIYVKAIPVLATLSHFLGAIALFFLGYTSFTSFDLRGLLLSFFFALLFSAGHITQDLRDLPYDLQGGIKTLPHLVGAPCAFRVHLYSMLGAFAFFFSITSLAIFL